MAWFLNHSFNKFKDCLISPSQNSDTFIKLYIQNLKIQSIKIKPILYDYFEYLRNKRKIKNNPSLKKNIPSYNETAEFVFDFLENIVAKDFKEDIVNIYKRIIYISSFIDQYIDYMIQIYDIEIFHKQMREKICLMRESKSQYSVMEHFIGEICHFISYGLTHPEKDSENDLVINDFPEEQTSSIYDEKNWKNISHIYRLVFGNLSTSKLFYYYEKVLEYSFEVLNVKDDSFSERTKMWINHDLQNPLDFIAISEHERKNQNFHIIKPLKNENEKTNISELDLRNIFDTIPYTLIQKNKNQDTLTRCLGIFGIFLGENHLNTFLSLKASQ
jgi:hypothetical protein